MAVPKSINCVGAGSGSGSACVHPRFRHSIVAGHPPAVDEYQVKLGRAVALSFYFLIFLTVIPPSRHVHRRKLEEYDPFDWALPLKHLELSVGDEGGGISSLEGRTGICPIILQRLAI